MHDVTRPVSMAGWLLAWAVVLAAGLLALGTLAVFGIALLPRGAYDLDVVRTELLSPPEDCPTPCWLGIQPGETTWEEVLALLEANAWIGPIDSQLRPRHVDEPTFDFGTILWLWSGRQPDWLATDQRSTITIEEGEVTAITLHTRLTLGDVWLLFGPPPFAALLPQGGITVVTAMRGPTRYFVGSYEIPRLDVLANWTCPLGLHARWWQPVTLTFTAAAPEGEAGQAWALLPRCE
ncbi:MAG: hypothetical protein JW910_06320 [Anaerolineae bacterium]|nr:hypothetical protein [Anaerolineae bacterium]